MIWLSIADQRKGDESILRLRKRTIFLHESKYIYVLYFLQI